MAIFLHSAGKTVETNKAALQRNARDHGDKIQFAGAKGSELVTLNGKSVGRLFGSHEQAIAFLSKMDKPKPRASARKQLEKATAKKNPASGRQPVRTRTSNMYKTKYNRDGSVTVWDVYRQQWMRQQASHVSDQVLASLPAEERNRIISMAEREVSMQD